MKLLISFNVACLLIIAFLVFSFFTINQKIVYVNTSEVFNEFKMTKEIDRDVKKIEEKKQAILDSLIRELKKMQTILSKDNEKQFEFLKQDFISKKGQFSEEISRLKQSSMDKIYNQINEYITQLGKEKGYQVILGANGQGSLMYAKENINITKDAIDYINEKYEGGK